jgi:Zn-dependent M28 family amino/carboxypeptidase
MRRLMPALMFLILVACSCVQRGAIPPELVSAPVIPGDAILQHTRILSSDEYEGRAPGTKGEDLSVAYIEDQFKKAGLMPGNPDGTYIQKVPLVGITPEPDFTLKFKQGGRETNLRFKDDFVAWTKRVVEDVKVESAPVVFAGYGVQAPEFGWDDFKGADLQGKMLLVLVGDPPVPDPADPNKLDSRIFGGKAMTYYGRWTYKYEMAAKLGAAGVLILHETEPAGYPFSVVQSKVTEQFDLASPDNNMGRAAIEGWVTRDQAENLCAMAGKNYEALKKGALSRDFKPILFDLKASASVHNKLRRIESRNVAGKLEGSDAKLRDEYVIFTSHWDHFGIGPEINGDRIYHGALDNATGVGGLIELARAYKALPQMTRRSLLFLSVTAEEQGLLGSAYYVGNPLYPLARTAGVLNMDALNVHGKTRDVVITGMGASELEDYAARAAEGQGRVVKPDPMPEKGSYYRSDHFPFARQGVPALSCSSGMDFIDKPEGYGKALTEKYIAEDYHKPSDIIKPDWDMSGAVQDLQFYWIIGYRVAQADKHPAWKPGAEFGPKSPAK